MIVIDGKNAKSQPLDDEIVQKGPVTRKPLLDAKETGGFGAALVTFNPGAKLNFHTHDAEQILYITEGKGILATKEKEYLVTAGCIVYIPPGEVHWHGATADTSMTHLTVQKPGIKLAK
jgi:quercetin dioxygenase-like cupin family protein